MKFYAKLVVYDIILIAVVVWITETIKREDKTHTPAIILAIVGLVVLVVTDALWVIRHRVQ